MREQISGVEAVELKVIARIHTDFPTKFGVPRQSGLADTRGVIIFETEYRNPDALRGIEEYSHLWLLWEFSQARREIWSPTVRPPRLGGNTRIGVFATRSPYRPNPIGLSCVKLEKVEMTAKYGLVVHVAGVDIMDGTPIYDIKPYLPYVDAHPEASGGFSEEKKRYELEVVIADKWLRVIPQEKRDCLRQVLAQDPRPSYQNDPERVYGMEFAGMEVKFRVHGRILEICEVVQKGTGHF